MEITVTTPISRHSGREINHYRILTVDIEDEDLWSDPLKIVLGVTGTDLIPTSDVYESGIVIVSGPLCANVRVMKNRWGNGNISGTIGHVNTHISHTLRTMCLSFDEINEVIGTINKCMSEITGMTILANSEYRYGVTLRDLKITKGVNISPFNHLPKHEF